MFNPFKLVETITYKIRDLFWSIPDFFVEDNRYRKALIKLYKGGSPYSNFIFSFSVVSLLTIILLSGSLPKIFSGTEKRLREGVVVGLDENGNLQKINKINPLLPSNVQLEKDLSELIYEPLIRYDFVQGLDGTYVGGATPVLAQEIIKIRQGSDYQFNLREGILWQDGEEFDGEDVIATFNIMASLNVQNAYVQALKQFHWELVDKYTVRVCTKDTVAPDSTCDGSADRPILSNFLELISVKIIPEHLSSDINDRTIEDSSAKLFKSPVGTGPYKFDSVTNNSILLTSNKTYYNKNKETYIPQIMFIFYGTLDKAVRAIESGEIHTLAVASSQYKDELQNYPNIETISSPVLDNQFWALYFNLRTKPDGSSVGPSFLTDKSVRQAISSAVNRTDILDDALSGVGKEATGPISEKSYFYNSASGWYTYNIVKAQQLLEEAGWTLRPNETVRTNASGEKMSFSLYFVDSYDRRRVAETIKTDLAKIGIEVIIDRQQEPGQDSSSTAPNGWSLDELNNQIVSPRLFDVLLYGMNTFIDPDRYELYESSQSQPPGLNISGYKGTAETVIAKTKEERDLDPSSSVKTVSKVDHILETARTFDPDQAKQDRKNSYDEFQSLLADDAPVVYLYHPQYIYYVHSDVKNVSLDSVSSIEDRFRNIGSWSLH